MFESKHVKYRWPDKGFDCLYQGCIILLKGIMHFLNYTVLEHGLCLWSMFNYKEYFFVLGRKIFRSAGNYSRLFDLCLPSLLLLELARPVFSFTLTSKIMLLALKGCSAFCSVMYLLYLFFRRLKASALLSHFGLHFLLAVELEVPSLLDARLAQQIDC
jgi:hypothetical protein